MGRRRHTPEQIIKTGASIVEMQTAGRWQSLYARWSGRPPTPGAAMLGASKL